MKRWLCLFICMCAMVLGNADVVKAATPRVMLSDYSIQEEDVISGKEFTLTLTMKNTAPKKVTNVKVSISTENGEMIPVDGAGTAYISEIAAEDEADLTFNMMAISGLQEKSYKLTIKTEYENNNGYGEYNVEETIFIPVTHEQRISLTDVFMEYDGLQLGDIVELSAVVNNMGAGTIYNVMVEVNGPNLQRGNTYLGNIESGKSATADILSKAFVLTSESTGKNQIIVTYEDQKGNSYEECCDLGPEGNGVIGVSEPVYENLEKVKDTADVSDVMKQILLYVVGIAVVVGIVMLWRRRMKRKQQILDEFIDSNKA